MLPCNECRGGAVCRNNEILYRKNETIYVTLSYFVVITIQVCRCNDIVKVSPFGFRASVCLHDIGKATMKRLNVNNYTDNDK